jgi:1-deoxy-D-xylulose-5-phosphate synthase
MRFVKPLDEKLLHAIFKKHKYIITVEDGAITGGFGSAILEFMSNHDYIAKIKRLGIPDKFIDHGPQKQLYKDCGFDSQGIVNAAKAIVKPSILSRVG